MKNIIFFLLFVNVVFGSVAETEKQALVDLYNATNGQNWFTKWDLNTDIKNWHGIKIINGTVVGIELVNNNLKGSIPESIKNLKNVKEINFFKNSISGQLPTQIFELPNLQILNLGFNNISGTIPENINHAKNLISLELFMNNLSGSLPNNIGELQNLETLSIFNNFINGSIPVSLYNLKNLKDLSLNSNLIEGQLSEQISKMTKLENLSLFDNKFTGVIPSLDALNKLKTMNLSLNNFSDYSNESLLSLDKFKLQMYVQNNKQKKVNLLDKNTLVTYKNETINENQITLNMK